jgi:hypothetical protein
MPSTGSPRQDRVPWRWWVESENFPKPLRRGPPNCSSRREEAQTLLQEIYMEPPKECLMEAVDIEQLPTTEHAPITMQPAPSIPSGISTQRGVHAPHVGCCGVHGEPPRPVAAHWYPKTGKTFNIQHSTSNVQGSPIRALVECCWVSWAERGGIDPVRPIALAPARRRVRASLQTVNFG